MKRLALAAAALLLLLLGVFLYFTPHLAVRRMREAAEARDSAAVSRYVDYPAVRESLKRALSAKLGAATGGSDSSLLAIGAAMAGALAGPLIDAFVTPESLALMLRGVRPSPGSAAPEPLFAEEPETTMGYDGFDRFVVRARRKGAADFGVELVFERSGIASWKLSAVSFPGT